MQDQDDMRGDTQPLIDEMKAYYDHRAPWHDDYMSYESNEVMEKRLAPIIEWLEPKIEGRRVLEIGCGTGNWTQVLARRAESVVAVDSSAKSIELAKQKQLLQRVQFAEADIYELSGLDGRFDVVFSGDLWSHIPLQHLTRLLENVHRTLADGGDAVWTDMLHRKADDVTRVEIDDHGNRIQLRELPDGTRYRVVKNLPSREELVALLGDQSTSLNYQDSEELLRWWVSYSLL